jgi:hypothetical protein
VTWLGRFSTDTETRLGFRSPHLVRPSGRVVAVRRIWGRYNAIGSPSAKRRGVGKPSVSPSQATPWIGTSRSRRTATPICKPWVEARRENELITAFTSHAYDVLRLALGNALTFSSKAQFVFEVDRMGLV